MNSENKNQSLTDNKSLLDEYLNNRLSEKKRIYDNIKLPRHVDELNIVNTSISWSDLIKK